LLALKFELIKGDRVAKCPRGLSYVQVMYASRARELMRLMSHCESSFLIPIRRLERSYNWRLF